MRPANVTVRARTAGAMTPSAPGSADRGGFVAPSMTRADRAQAVPDAHVLTPALHGDDRGTFLEWFRQDELAAAGHPFGLAQANCLGPPARRGARRPLRRRPARAGQVRDLRARGRARRRRRRAGRVADLRRVGRRPARRPRPAGAVHRPRGSATPSARWSDDSVGHVPVQRRLRPGAEHGINPLDPELGIELAGRPRAWCYREGRRRAHPRPRPGARACCPPRGVPAPSASGRPAAADREAATPRGARVVSDARDHPRGGHRAAGCTPSPWPSASS